MAGKAADVDKAKRTRRARSERDRFAEAFMRQLEIHVVLHANDRPAFVKYLAFTLRFRGGMEVIEVVLARLTAGATAELCATKGLDLIAEPHLFLYSACKEFLTKQDCMATLPDMGPPVGRVKTQGSSTAMSVRFNRRSACTRRSL